MFRSRSRLSDVHIASPCNASWDGMAGSDRVRYCQQCRRNVYNLSAMSRAEAEELVRQRETQQLCIRFYRRHDGTMLTADCPVGLRRLRRAALRSWGTLVGGLAAVLTLALGCISFSTSERRSSAVARQVEPFASLLAWLDPQIHEPDPSPPPEEPLNIRRVIMGF
jgi:hypothetical protein